MKKGCAIFIFFFIFIFNIDVKAYFKTNNLGCDNNGQNCKYVYVGYRVTLIEKTSQNSYRSIAYYDKISVDYEGLDERSVSITKNFDFKIRSGNQNQKVLDLVGNVSSSQKKQIIQSIVGNFNYNKCYYNYLLSFEPIYYNKNDVQRQYDTSWEYSCKWPDGQICSRGTSRNFTCECDYDPVYRRQICEYYPGKTCEEWEQGRTKQVNCTCGNDEKKVLRRISYKLISLRDVQITQNDVDNNRISFIETDTFGNGFVKFKPFEILSNPTFNQIRNAIGSSYQNYGVSLSWLGYIGNSYACELFSSAVCPGGNRNYYSCMDKEIDNSNYYTFTEPKTVVQEAYYYCYNDYNGYYYPSYIVGENDSCKWFGNVNVDYSFSCSDATYTADGATGTCYKNITTTEAKNVCPSKTVAYKSKCYWASDQKKSSRFDCPDGYSLKCHSVGTKGAMGCVCYKKYKEETKTKENKVWKCTYSLKYVDTCYETLDGTFVEVKHCGLSGVPNSKTQCCEYNCSYVDSTKSTTKKVKKVAFAKPTCKGSKYSAARKNNNGDFFATGNFKITYGGKDFQPDKDDGLVVACGRDKTTEVETNIETDYAPELLVTTVSAPYCLIPNTTQKMDSSYYDIIGAGCYYKKGYSPRKNVLRCDSGQLEPSRFYNRPLCRDINNGDIRQQCNDYICSASCIDSSGSIQDITSCIEDEVAKGRTYLNAKVYCTADKCLDKCDNENEALQIIDANNQQYKSCVIDKINGNVSITYEAAKSECKKTYCSRKCYSSSVNSSDGNNTNNPVCDTYDISKEYTLNENIRETAKGTCDNVTDDKRVSKYGTLAYQTNNYRVFCKQQAQIKLPGNISEAKRRGSYFEWPTSSINSLMEMKMVLTDTCYVYTKKYNDTNVKTLNSDDIINSIKNNHLSNLMVNMQYETGKLGSYKTFIWNKNNVNVEQSSSGNIAINYTPSTANSFKVISTIRFKLDTNLNRYFNRNNNVVTSSSNQDKEIIYDRKKGNIDVPIDAQIGNYKLKITGMKLGRNEQFSNQNMKYTCTYKVKPYNVTDEECICSAGTLREGEELPYTCTNLSCSDLQEKYCHSSDVIPANNCYTCRGKCVWEDYIVNSLKNIKAQNKKCNGSNTACDIDFECINNRTEVGNIKVCVKNYLRSKGLLKNNSGLIEVAKENINKAMEYCSPKVCNYNNSAVIIYRQIDINNPFPGRNGSGRIPGSNWSSNPVIKTKITETKKDNPLYVIRLTPSDMKNIRSYNVRNTYDDFNMKCLSKNKGENCSLYTSKFLNDYIFGGRCKEYRSNYTDFYKCVSGGI